MLVELTNKDAYHLEKHAGEYLEIDTGSGVPVFLLRRLAPTMPDEFRVDVYGWGPFKQLVLRR